MKTIRIIAVSLCLILAFGVKLSAQTEYKSNEMSLSYGRISVPSVAEAFGSVMGVVISGGHVEPDELGSSGAFGVEYFHYFNKTLSLGASIVYESCRLTFKHEGDDDFYDDGDKVSSSDSFISVMPEFKVRWLYRPHFGMYSKIGAGVMFMPGNTTAAAFTFQLSPLGIEAGSDKIRGFLEGGFGAQGAILLGIRFSF